MAFQPIVDVEARTVYAYEALVRGPQGQSAYEVLRKVKRSTRHAFDQHCQIHAMTLAARLDLAKTGARLSINLMSGVRHGTSECIQLIADTAASLGLESGKLIFEISENQPPRNEAEISRMADEYRSRGFLLAIDDFGTGHSGLSRLADLSVDIIKLDRKIVHNVAQRKQAQEIVRCTVQLARSLGCQLIAEGIETIEEHDALVGLGVRLMQGYLFAKPGFETLPQITWPRVRHLAIAA